MSSGHSFNHNESARPARRIDPEHVGGYFHGGDRATWCPALWQWLVRRYRIRSVLDVGCGEGQSTQFFQQQGCRVLGVDGSPAALRDSVVPDRVALHDFTDGPFLADEKYDMIWSCEFVEHIDEPYLDHVLTTFAQVSRLIAITHAFPGQRGHHHVNCRRNPYWIQHIESLGFTCLVQETRAARIVTFADYPSINHFARSGLLFVRAADFGTRLPLTPACKLRAHLKSWQIRLPHRLSAAYREQMRRRRVYHRERRAARRAKAA